MKKGGDRMANILDYLKWRGDLPFSRDPFNDVDALVFSRLSYIPFDGVVSEHFQKMCIRDSLWIWWSKEILAKYR